MRAVSNTSPISNLAIIGRLELLKRRYSAVLIPAAVEAELAQLRHSAARHAIQGAKQTGWLQIREVSAAKLTVSFARLDAGEKGGVTARGRIQG